MSEKNYYQILGLSRLATADQIKKRYRQLARIYHPDVQADKEASSKQFIEISNAYRTLSDPDKRMIYDASLDREFLNYQSQVQSAYRKKKECQQTSSQQKTYTQTSKKIYDIEGARAKVKEAELAFISHKFKQAISACNAAIKLNANNVRAYIILGDIYRIQGFNEQAISMYTVALQLDPTNHDVQSKLDRVARHQMSEQYGYTEKLSISKQVIVFMFAALILGMILRLAYFPGEPIPWLKTDFAFISTWSVNLIVSMFIIGALAGIILSLINKINPMDEELFFQGVKTPGRIPSSYPIGLLLLIFNIFSFYLAAIIYIVVGLTQDSISKSVFTVFTTVFVCSIICEIAYTPSSLQVIAYGGNVIFPGALCGWMLGDVFRPTW